MDEREALEALSLLNDDIRRRLYRFVRASGDPVTRGQAAKGVSISAKLAAFHLDKLVEGGLLDAGFDTPSGLRRRVGRAPKRYRPSTLEVSLSLPERRYDMVGEILLEALRQAGMVRQPLDAARDVAFARGQQVGAARREQLHTGRLGAERTVAEAGGLLAGLGFEPAEGPEGLLLRNCPFHRLAQRDPELVCGLTAAFIDGMLRGLGNTNVRADLEPEEGLCCVRLRPPRSTASTAHGS